MFQCLSDLVKAPTKGGGAIVHDDIRSIERLLVLFTPLSYLLLDPLPQFL